MNASPAEPASIVTTSPTLDVYVADDGTVMVHGELDIATRAILGTVVGNAPREASLRIDMHDVTFIDSSGLGLLISTYLSRDGEVRVVNPSRPVERALRLTYQYDRFVGG